MSKSLDLVIERGKTFNCTVRWEQALPTFKAISNISQTAPARVTAAAHGVPDGWRVAVYSVKGMKQINAVNNPPRERDMYVVKLVDTSNLDLTTVNAADFSAYTSGGYLMFYAPVALTGFTARMTIKDKVGGTALLTLTQANSRILIDTTANTVTVVISAADTAALTWTRGVYDLEAESPGGVVTALLSGNVIVSQEVTT